MSAMTHTTQVILAAILGIAFSILQLWLMQRVIKASAGWQRGVLMMLKIPLWALMFIGIVLWWGVWPLVGFGIAAGATYLTVAIIYWVRTHPRAERKP